MRSKLRWASGGRRVQVVLQEPLWRPGSQGGCQCCHVAPGYPWGPPTLAPERGQWQSPPLFSKRGVLALQKQPCRHSVNTFVNSRGLKVSKILLRLPLVSKPPKCHTQVCGWHNVDFYTGRGITCSLDILGYLLTTRGVPNSVYLSL